MFQSKKTTSSQRHQPLERSKEPLTYTCQAGKGDWRNTFQGCCSGLDPFGFAPSDPAARSPDGVLAAACCSPHWGSSPKHFSSSFFFKSQQSLRGPGQTQGAKRPLLFYPPSERIHVADLCLAFEAKASLDFPHHITKLRGAVTLNVM